MRFQSEVVVRALQELEVQVAEFRAHTAALANAWSRGDIPLVVRATGDARRVFETTATAMMGLKNEIIQRMASAVRWVHWPSSCFDRPDRWSLYK